jgi:peptide/nickel transport system substrate-binding protein
MDPAHYVGGEEYNIDLAIHAKLYRYAPGSQELILDAAKSVEVSEDGTKISFVLREGIQFHEGYGELTAEDVKFSFERHVDPRVASEYKDDWQTLCRVDVTGKYTGDIILTQPYAPLFVNTIPYTSGSIISKAAYEDLGEKIATHPIGAGPYYWAKWIPEQKVVLERFDDYFGELPDFKRIEILPIADDKAAELAFDSGELDETFVSLESIDGYRANPDVNVVLVNNLRYHWIGFNVQHPPFDNIRVREAVRYVVDVDEILQGAFNGVAPRAKSMVAPGILGYWEDAPEYQPDLERARSLLEEAGYPDGFEVELSTASDPRSSLVVQIVKQQLAQVGIEARIKIVEGSLYNYIGKEDHPGMHYYAYSAILDPGYWFEWFTCDQVGKWNVWKWCNEEYDRIKDEAGLTMDREERGQLYIQLQQMMDEDVSCIWLTNGASPHVYRDNVEPVYLAMFSQYRYWKKPE